MRNKLQPYVGPRPFERGDQALFFGRDREARDLLSLVVAHEAVLLYAQSGAGKTSLLNAMLIPFLEEKGFQVLPTARVRGSIPEGIEPDQIPNLYVLNTLVSWAGDESQPEDLARMSLAQFLSAREQPDDEEEEGTDSTRRAIIFDQFEELFSFYPERWKEREDFFRQVAEILTDPALRVLFAMREDYLASLTPYASLLPERLRTRYRLERLRAEAAQQAVEKPLQDTGYSFADGVAASLVQELLNIKAKSVTDEMVDVPGEYVEPVQLQVVCQNLWLNLPSNVEVITADHLQSFGDVEEALRSFYERAIETAEAKSGVNKDDLRRWFHEQLITPVGTRGTVFRGDEQTGGILNSAVDMLEDQHIIRAEMRSGARWYELTHDRLIEPIRKANEAWHEEEQKRRIEEERVKAQEQARIAKRFRRLTAALVVLFLAAASISVFAFYQRQEAKDQTRLADKSREEAEKQTQIALSRQLVAQAFNHLDSQLDLSLLLSLEAGRIDDTLETRSSLFSGSLFSGVYHSPHLNTFLHGHRSRVYSVSFSPDPNGKLLASGSDDNTIILWDVEAKEQVGQLTGHEDPVLSVCFSPDGKLLASGSYDNTIILWDVAKGQQMGQSLIGHKADVNSVSFSPDGKLLASGSDDNTIILWDVATQKQVGQPLKGHKYYDVYSVCFSPDPDSNLLASGSADKTIILWDVATQKQVGQLTGHKGAVLSVCFSSDGKLLASGSGDRTIILWDVATRLPVGEPLKGHKSYVYSISFSPDGKLLASGSRDNSIILWDVATQKQVGQPLTGHKNSVRSVCFSPDPDSNLLASGSYDNTTILWDVEIGQWTGHESSVNSVCFSPDGNLLASGSNDNTIILWDVETGQQMGQSLIGHKADVNSVCFSPDPDSNLLASGSDGKRLASGSYDYDQTIILWDVATGQRVGEPLTGHRFRSDVLSVCFSPDGNLLASGSWDDTIILWDVATGQPVGEPLTGHKNSLRSVCFSPDGKRLASGSSDNTIILWDVETRKRVDEPLKGHKDSVRSVCFSRDGNLLASGSADKTIILWDVKTGQQIGQSLIGHKADVVSVSFNPDGKRLVSGSLDNTIILWDVETRQQVGQPLTEHKNFVMSVSFSPDGKTLASGSTDKTIILWDDVDPDSWPARARRIVNRNLTDAEWKQYLGDEQYRKTFCDLPGPGEN
jgi:WD40 repeat protein